MDKLIKFDPALPCSTINGDALCNKPAHVGIAYPATGGWMLQPICADCTQAMAKVYSVVFWSDELKPEKEQPTHGTNG